MRYSLALGAQITFDNADWRIPANAKPGAADTLVAAVRRVLHDIPQTDGVEESVRLKRSACERQVESSRVG